MISIRSTSCKVIVTAAAIWHFHRGYSGLGWSWQSVVMGVAVFGVWMMLEAASDTSPVEAGLAALPYWAAGIWLLFFRVAGSVIIVPVAEELAFSGYLMRKLIARDFENVPLNRFTWFSFLLSPVIFGLLHNRWLAGIIAGMLFALALYRRGQLGDAVVAHLAANALIAAYVHIYPKWALWL